MESRSEVLVGLALTLVGIALLYYANQRFDPDNYTFTRSRTVMWVAIVPVIGILVFLHGVASTMH